MLPKNAHVGFRNLERLSSAHLVAWLTFCSLPAEWPEFVRNYAPWWATHTLDWLKFGKTVLVVHFEDLKQDLFTQLGRMVSLLGVAVREDRLLCVESQKDGNFKRSGLRKLEYDPYTAEMRRTIAAYIRMVDTALRSRNLTGVPDAYGPR